MSWCNAPTLLNSAFAPILSAHAYARLATFKEWWKVPGASYESFFNKPEFVSDNSSNETSETNLNIFS